jgi:hypothetical protein
VTGLELLTSVQQYPMSVSGNREPAINSLTQHVIALSILRVLNEKKRTVSNPIASRLLYRTDVIYEAKINGDDISINNVNGFVEKLAKMGLVELVGRIEDNRSWWTFIVTEKGEKQLLEEIKKRSLA